MSNGMLATPSSFGHHSSLCAIWETQLPGCQHQHQHKLSLTSQSHHPKRVDVDTSLSNTTAKIQRSCSKEQLLAAGKLILDPRTRGTILDQSYLSTMMLSYASKGLIQEAEAILDKIFNRFWSIDVNVISRLVEICGYAGNFDMIGNVLDKVKLRDSNLLRHVFSQVIASFGRKGEIELMEFMLKQMVSMGMNVDSASGNAYVVCCSLFGSLSDTKIAYEWLKRSRILVEEEGIRSIAFAYIREEKFYGLGKFVENVGLGRRNVGNLLWNLLILSYAAKFKMKSMQREFVKMVESGFCPDLTTFNIRAIAFSKMMLFWDLHLSLDHMKHLGVTPDLVTYGCVVDAYLERRLGKNLGFALQKMSSNDSVVVSTDPLVFEAMGKGDFHLTAEALLEFSKKREWTYKELIAVYVRKKLRSNQIFWNY